MKSLIQVIFFGLICQMSFGQGSRLLREPTISDQYIVFVHANDLWRVEKEGGQAIRLTSNEGQEQLPRFSPDGKHVAFTAQYDGNTDVYIIPTEGGEPKRLTWHPGADLVTGWTPDSKHILFTSARENVPTKEPKLVIEGSDPQLEKAVMEALRLLETEGVELKPEPAAPIRYFRPEKKD